MTQIRFDSDPNETEEWVEALRSVVEYEGKARAEFLLNTVLAEGQQHGLNLAVTKHAYVNTLTSEEEGVFPGDLEIEHRILNINYWNAVMMVLRAGKKDPALGGHISTPASSATLYTQALLHFLRADSEIQGSDLVFFQGHSSPGIYAYAFLEGRLTQAQLDRFRREIKAPGLSSYPHPWLMPDFWQFPTVSMGLGILQAIYQARFLKYLEHREFIKAVPARKVWYFAGDGEMDEPESLGALTVAGREQLDNLIVVINCNLQRLDGPVRGNGKIIQEMEGVFQGAGWRVIKLIWGAKWDALLEKDTSGLLRQRMMEVVDGEYQVYPLKDGAYIRQHFFGKYPELTVLVSDLSDEYLVELMRDRGGHDMKKVFSAYQVASQSHGQPTVILAKTIKGYRLGAAGEAQNIAHNQKKMTLAQLQTLRTALNLPLEDAAVANLEYYHPGAQSAEAQYLLSHRKSLGGALPARKAAAPSLTVPALEDFSAHLQGSQERAISTTMAYVRIFQTLLKDRHLGSRVVPIVPDEARTFGMEGLFRQIGIYSPQGQLYDPVDSSQLMYYREAQNGQFLQEGITEAGAFASWMAAATAYSTHQMIFIPFYIYYSMFGMQRIGDLAWAAADAQARGFLLGSLAGRTTLAGEGFQHQDGHNLLFFSAIPNCLCYDPTFAYEIAVIIQEGLRRMVEQQENVFYYLTLMNENYVHPPMPEGVESGIIKGMYCFSESLAVKATSEKNKKSRVSQVQLLGSGAILREVIKAAEWLNRDFQIETKVWSVTSFTELRREALAVERENRFHPTQSPKQSYVTQCLQNSDGPVIAVTDYMRLNADQIRGFVPHPYVVLGTDGFGRSDTREELRDFFEIDARYIVLATLQALSEAGKVPPETVELAMQQYSISSEKPDPVKL